jgi:hypothetical protein
MSNQPAVDVETMPLAELKALALAEAEKAATPETPKVTPQASPVMDQGKDEFDNSDDDAKEAPADVVEAAAEAEPEEYIYERKIDLGDGSGIQVFRGKGATKEEALEALTDKLADAQTHATKKIHELTKQVKVEDTRTAQEKADDEYVIQERMKETPGKTMREIVNQVIEERESATKRSLASQTSFVNSHPDYIADPDNGARMSKEVQNLGFSEFTEEGLEKAYQSLKKSGLLKLKTEGADAVTEDEGAEPERIAQPVPEATQPRSPKKSSTVRSSGRAPVVKTEPTEDELYSMPLEKLRKLGNEQLAKANRE